jgi:glycosyltransferase involved in cell wall biosynthesis
VDRENLTVVYNGVDVQAFRPCTDARAALRRKLGLRESAESADDGREEPFVWLAVGRLEMVKDYPTLLKAMVNVPRPARLLIAGHGPLLGNLAHLSSRLGLGGRVRFLGYEPDISLWMQAADGFVLTSRWEGLPMALLEAGACGLPAIATDVPGSREVIVDDETGVLVPAANPDALAWAMTAMMRMPAERRMAMGAQARQRIMEEFSVARAVERWEELYGGLLRTKSQARVVRGKAADSSSKT